MKFETIVVLVMTFAAVVFLVFAELKSRRNQSGPKTEPEPSREPEISPKPRR